MGNEQSQQGYTRAHDSDYPGVARHSGGSGAHPPPAAGRSGVTPDSGSAASAAERAAALEAKLQKKRPKPKDVDAIKAEHWKKYNEIGGSSAQAEPVPLAQQSHGYRLADSAVVRRDGSTQQQSAGSMHMPAPSAPPAPANFTAAPVPAAVAAQANPAYAGVPYINRSKAPPTADQLLHGQKRYETQEEAAIRAQRAALFTQNSRNKAAKAASRQEDRWRAYKELESATEGSQGNNTLIVNAPLPFGSPSSSDAPYSSAPVSPDPFYATPTPTPPPTGAFASAAAAASSASASSAPGVPAHSAPAIGDSLFEQQMAALSAKVRRMPAASVTLLKKILQNLLKAGEQPDEEGKKFRKIKLSNPKIAEGIVAVDGAMELLMAVGFEQRQATAAPPPGSAAAASSSAPPPPPTELFLVFPDGMSLDIAQLAYQQLAAFTPSHFAPLA